MSPLSQHDGRVYSYIRLNSVVEICIHFKCGQMDLQIHNNIVIHPFLTFLTNNTVQINLYWKHSFFKSFNPQNDNRLFIELRVQYLKIQNWGKHVVYRNCFLHSEEFLYTTIFSPCSAKRRASDKELSVLKTKTI